MRWRKGLSKVQSRVSWLITKYRQTEQNGGEEVWLDRIARGSGDSRHRVKVELPVYGDVELDQQETDALKLPPKTAVMTGSKKVT